MIKSSQVVYKGHFGSPVCRISLGHFILYITMYFEIFRKSISFAITRSITLTKLNRKNIFSFLQINKQCQFNSKP